MTAATSFPTALPLRHFPCSTSTAALPFNKGKGYLNVRLPRSRRAPYVPPTVKAIRHGPSTRGVIAARGPATCASHPVIVVSPLLRLTCEFLALPLRPARYCHAKMSNS
ncbi:Hypothetical protein NTJ_11389 [Nesidiocoris tenuis]|uniref:Uncharacterized protein n=1 Tax=Nesidiocoris tenuis TaxID=355587 RepID=A0ABN7B2D3_9HEMI|nr:Hypothetical protein NTJ_11389 [Nesidiocoris tenuis]